jgi:probable HAF family extracellular repeat protein
MKGKHRTIILVCATAGLVLAVLLWPGPKAMPLYRVIVLPSLGGPMTVPSAINNHGQIVGYSEATDGSCHLCLWEPNGYVQDLGPAVHTRYYLNDAGQIAGMMRDPNGNHVAFVRDPAGSVRMLGTLGGTESVAQGLNNRGQVVGWSRTAEGLKHAFVWDQTAGMRDLSAPEGDDGEARAINNRGQIIGAPDGRVGWPTLWTPAGSTWATEPLQSLFGGCDINSGGYMAGWQSLPGGRRCMVLWRSGDLPKVLFPLDYEIERCRTINDANQVLFTEWHHHVLRYVTLGRLVPWPIEYWIWDPNRGRIPLNPQVLTRRGEIFEAFDLNDSGCIVGRVTGRDWTRGTYVRPVLLEPIHERWRKTSGSTRNSESRRR